MTRYMGRIIKTSPKGYAWIDRSSVTEVDGSPADLATDKDIYIHHTDCELRLDVGLELTFEIVPDAKRASGFRAADAKRVRVRKLGIDLHVDATRVEHPTVPMRWCFTPVMYKRITEGLKKGYGYAVMLVGRQRNDEYGFREVREVFGWKQPFTFFTFTAPGDWDVCAVLFERKDVSTVLRSTSSLLEVSMRSMFGSRSLGAMGRKTFDHGIGDLEDLQYIEDPWRMSIGRWTDNGQPIAAQTITVSLPKEIFAAEPSEAVKAYGNYFFRHQPGDQCEFRQRLMMMVPGFVPWVVIEGLKRLGFLLVGVVGLLFFLCIAPDALKQAFKPAIKLGMPEDTEYDTENGMMRPFNKTPLGWFVPGMLLIYAAALWLAVKIILPIVFKIVVLLIGVIVANWVIILSLIGAIVLTLCALGLVHYLRMKTERPEAQDKRRKAKETRVAEQKAAALVLGEHEATMAVQFAPALVCGDAPAEVSLKAIPRELRTRHMLFASLKQQVCKPFAH